MARKHNKPAAPPKPRQNQSASIPANDPGAQYGMQAARAAVESLQRGDVAGAAGVVEQGLRQAPRNADLWHLGGQAALHLGDVGRGKEMIRRAIDLAPKVALYHYNLGNALFAEKDLDGALQSFRQAVRLEPRFPDAFTNLGIVFTRKHQHEEAEAAFEQVLRMQPDSAQAVLNLAICDMELRKPDKVSELTARLEALVGQPDQRLLHEIGNLYRGLGRHLVAEEYYRRALDLNDSAAEIWFALGDVLSQAGEGERAAEALAKAESLGLQLGPIRLAQARLAIARDAVGDAKRLLGEASELSQDSITYLLRIAHQYTLIGDFAAQEKLLNRVLEINPDNVGAFSGLTLAPGRKLSEDDALKLRRLADDKSVDTETRTSIGFALGDYYRYAKKYDDSFRYYRLGNRLKGYSFDRIEYQKWLSDVEALFTRAFFDERSAWGSDSRMPVLIVGMPRSGTTLTEQIVSSHPAIFGAGEYGTVSGLATVRGLPSPDFRRQLDLATELTADQVAQHAESYLNTMKTLAAHGESFVTNKLPHNFQQLGLFGMLFPNAPVIHIKRDPRDNLLSIYFQDFAGFHDYAYDLKTLGVYYRLYERLMAHWTRVIPNPVYTLQYEELVADLPGKTQELADFIGVDLDERMLRFYEQERKVETASKWQVRQKLYTTSVQRWKPYEKHLQPLFDALGPID
ncbi:MAG: sulfotransferase [Gammaproteobacteria bacterium]|nr:sulfotransferase [Gammaproteobacteria bacterium]